MQCLAHVLLLDKVFMGEFKNPFGLLGQSFQSKRLEFSADVLSSFLCLVKGSDKI